MRIRQCFAELMRSHELCRAAVGARGEACWGAGGAGSPPAGPGGVLAGWEPCWACWRGVFCGWLS